MQRPFGRSHSPLVESGQVTGRAFKQYGENGMCGFFVQIALTGIWQNGKIRRYIYLRGWGVYRVFVMSWIDASREGVFSDGLYAAVRVAVARAVREEERCSRGSNDGWRRCCRFS